MSKNRLTPVLSRDVEGDPRAAARLQPTPETSGRSEEYLNKGTFRFVRFLTSTTKKSRLIPLRAAEISPRESRSKSAKRKSPIVKVGSSPKNVVEPAASCKSHTGRLSSASETGLPGSSTCSQNLRPKERI